MVYCGKASQGCQNCRTRRIKCDKINPECSQCVRVGKKCPGYRDQLSLMFRDESSKVIQKARAQWAAGVVEESSQQASLLSHHPSGPKSPVSTGTCSAAHNMFPSSSLPLLYSIPPTWDQQGIEFYIDRYVLGHPDEPKGLHELDTSGWIWHPSLQDIMAAVGLGSLSNLTGDCEMMVVARQKYGAALRKTSDMIQDSSVSPLVTMRSVVFLALFEVVTGTHHSTGTPYAHVMGGAALLRSWLPMPSTPFGGFRALLQLCYTMFIPIHVNGKTLPPPFVDWVSFASERQPPHDRPAGDLARLVARFVQISSFVRRHALSDHNTKTSDILRYLIKLDSDFEAWEAGVAGDWCFRKLRDASLPPQAVFEGEYHLYEDMWTARIWNHYRWGRILTKQMMLEFVNQYPASSLPLLSMSQQIQHSDAIRRLSRDTLISVPSHWRHPLLPQGSLVPVEKMGTAGSGAAGIPPLLFQLKVAACAPGVPHAYWEWAVNIMECVWGDMGMMHARSMMESLRMHRATEHHSTPDILVSKKYINYIET